MPMHSWRGATDLKESIYGFALWQAWQMSPKAHKSLFNGPFRVSPRQAGSHRRLEVYRRCPDDLIPVILAFRRCAHSCPGCGEIARRACSTRVPHADGLFHAAAAQKTTEAAEDSEDAGDLAGALGFTGA